MKTLIDVLAALSVGHTGGSPQCSGKSVPQRTKGNGAETVAKVWRQPIV